MSRLGSIAVALVPLLILSPAKADAATKPGVSAKVARDTLTVTGSPKADKIILRNGRHDTLEVDAGGSSAAEFRFERATFKQIVVRVGGGGDRVTVGDRVTATTVHGGAGSDRVLVIGSARPDSLLGASAGRQYSLSGRAIGVRDVETLAIDPRGGADELVLGAVNRTGVRELELILGRDGARDEVRLHGTQGPDSFTVAGKGAKFNVDAPGARLSASGADPGSDRLTIFAQAGADVISAAGLDSGVLLTASGDFGDDVVTGSPGDDTLDGGEGTDTLTGGGGADVVAGGHGNDSADLGAGGDEYRWEPGDGDDRIEGGDGPDRIAAGGTDAPDDLTVTEAGSRLRVARGDGTADAGAIERVDLAGRGGADRMTVNGTDGDDAIAVSGDAAAVSITRPVPVTLAQPEPGDHLIVNGHAGNDTIDASALAAGAIALTLDGGAGDDTLTGGAGDDLLVGGPGDDRMFGGPGNDSFDTSEGSDTAVQ